MEHDTASHTKADWKGKPKGRRQSHAQRHTLCPQHRVRWDDLPKAQDGHWYTTAWRRLKTWEDGVWKRMFDALIARGYSLGIVKMGSLSIDSTTVPAKKGASSLASTVISASKERRSTR